MDDHDEDFPRELDEIRIRHYRDDPDRKMSYEPALVARIVGYIWARRLHGETLEQCSQNLDISAAQLRRWLWKAARNRPPGPAAAAPARALVRPVQITAELVRIPDGVPEKRYTLYSPAGYR